MISQRNRFHGHGSLKYVFQHGRMARSRLISIKYIANPKRKHSRISVIISKKVYKGAVGRNRMRRKIYEIIREELGDFAGVYDVAFMVFSSDVLTLSRAELYTQIHQLLAQSRILSTK